MHATRDQALNACALPMSVLSSTVVGMSQEQPQQQDTDQEMLGAPTPETGGSDGSGVLRDPAEWVTGDEPITEAQRSYLDTLAREAGEQIPADMTKAEASQHIDRLRTQSERVSDEGTDKP